MRLSFEDRWEGGKSPSFRTFSRIKETIVIAAVGLVCCSPAHRSAEEPGRQGFEGQGKIEQKAAVYKRPIKIDLKQPSDDIDNITKSYCTVSPEIDVQAKQHKVDPTFLRAFVLVEQLPSKTATPIPRSRLVQRIHNLSGYITRAKSWARSQIDGGILNPLDTQRITRWTYFVAANMDNNVWDTKMGDVGGYHGPRMRVGEYWTKLFQVSYEVNKSFCSPPSGSQLPPQCFGIGEPDKYHCYGYIDFIDYVVNCELFRIENSIGLGSKVWDLYQRLQNMCKI